MMAVLNHVVQYAEAYTVLFAWIVTPLVFYWGYLWMTHTTDALVAAVRAESSEEVEVAAELRQDVAAEIETASAHEPVLEEVTIAPDARKENVASASH